MAMKTKIVQIPIFRQTLQLLFGEEAEIRETLVNTFELPEAIVEEGSGSKHCCGFMRYYEYNNEYYLWLPSIPVSRQEYGTLVHELQHFVFYFLEGIGMKHTEDSDEVYSYLLEYLFCEADIWISELKEDAESDEK